MLKFGICKSYYFIFLADSLGGCISSILKTMFKCLLKYDWNIILVACDYTSNIIVFYKALFFLFIIFSVIMKTHENNSSFERGGIDDSLLLNIKNISLDTNYIVIPTNETENVFNSSLLDVAKCGDTDTSNSNETGDNSCRQHTTAADFNETFEQQRNNTEDSPQRKVYIGGLFELTGSRGNTLGHSELIAARLAVKHVNKAQLLPGHELVLLHNDTKVRTY